MTEIDDAIENMLRLERAIESGAVTGNLTLISDVRRIIWQLLDIKRRMEKAQP